MDYRLVILESMIRYEFYLCLWLLNDFDTQVCGY